MCNADGYLYWWFNGYTTTKAVIYDAPSMTVIENRFRIWHGGNFVNIRTKICFYFVHSKVVINNRLIMGVSANIVISIN